MSNPLLTRKRILALAAESAFGSAASLTNANAGFKVEDRSLKIIRPTAQRQAQGSGGQDVGVAEEAHTELSLTARWTGNSSTNMATLAGLLLPACGFVESTGTFSRTWSSSNWASLSAGAYMDGIKTLARGLMGNLKWTFVPGKMVNVEATMMGGYVANPSDAAILTGMTYESVTPAVWSPASGTSGTNLTIDGNTFFKPGQMQLDLGNVVSLREDPNSAGGYLCAWIGEGAARITLDPEAYNRSVYDFFASQSTSDTFTVSAVLDGGSNNTWTWSGTFQVSDAPDFGDRNGKVTENIVLTEVNDSLTITKA
jgi:hypothetical protein